MRSFLRFIAVVVLALGAWLLWGLVIPRRAPQPAAGQPPATVLLRPGWSSRRIAGELQSAGVIPSARAFLLLHAIRLRRLKAGEYLFDRPATAIQVYNRIALGDIYFHTVTVPEGFNMFDIAAAVQQAGLGPAADFLKAAGDPTSIHDLDPQARSLEGYLFPDTYQFTRAQSMQDMAGEMLRQFRQKGRALGLVPAPGSPPTTDLHALVTMASIVEKETSAPEERPLIAGVYYNRLQHRIALQADPSVIYAAQLAGRYSGEIHRSDLDADSPYNTYKYPGLPPGPICNPGEASLQAAMHPAQTDYLYFVSDNNGHHRFAATLDEHAKNVQAYRRGRR
ncbi:MAG: endolytic transglycosylase MltG [Acidobacteria bacterium]|nr:endolytic transglycosylase MltG [Acidobacteriota bacterium]